MGRAGEGDGEGDALAEPLGRGVTVPLPPELLHWASVMESAARVNNVAPVRVIRMSVSSIQQPSLRGRRKKASLLRASG